MTRVKIMTSGHDQETVILGHFHTLKMFLLLSLMNVNRMVAESPNCQTVFNG